MCINLTNQITVLVASSIVSETRLETSHVSIMHDCVLVQQWTLTLCCSQGRWLRRANPLYFHTAMNTS